MNDLVSALEASQVRGFLGPGPVREHIEHSQAFLAAVAPPARALDLGSGGGVPGLVLAVTWADAELVLLDAQLRRVRFLQEAVEALDLVGRVAVVHGRAEELARDEAHRGRYDVVTARSFGPPAITAECGAGLLVEGGALLVSAPPSGDAERWPAEGLAAVGLVDAGLVEGPHGGVRVLRSVGGPLDTVPRRSAAMVRSPRF